METQRARDPVPLPEEDDATPATLPSEWMLSNHQLNRGLSPAPGSQPGGLEAYPRDWSLTTIPESIISDTQAPSSVSEDTIRGDFPIALSGLSDTASAISAESPFAFKTGWSLLKGASTSETIVNSPDVHYSNPYSSSWSLKPPNVPQYDTENLNEATVLGRVPRHVVPGARISSDTNTSAESPGITPSSIPGNFRPHGYAVSSGTVASHSSYGNLPGHVRFAPQSSMPAASPSSAAWSASNPSPGEAVYKPSRPAGFGSATTPSPMNSGSQNPAVEAFHPGRPKGFAADTSSSSAMSTNSQSPAQHENSGKGISGSVPTGLLAQGSRFPPLEIDILAETLPTNVDSWLNASAKQLYGRPPAAPLKAFAPWHARFGDSQDR